MSFGWRQALTGAAVVFLVFLLARLWPAGWSRRRLVFDGEMRSARERARMATAPRERAEALCEAGALASRARRWTAAAGYFLRAMRADPTWADAVTRAREALGPRPRLLDKILWRRLAQLEWDGEEQAAARAVAAGIAAIRPRTADARARALVARKLAERLGEAPPG